MAAETDGPPKKRLLRIPFSRATVKVSSVAAEDSTENTEVVVERKPVLETAVGTTGKLHTYWYGKSIGHHGEHGIVYTCEDDTYCVKDFRKKTKGTSCHGTPSMDLSSKEGLLKDTATPGNSNVVTFVELVTLGGISNAGYVMERASSTLASVRNEPLTFCFGLQECKILARQLVNGLAYLHNKDIVHRDIGLGSIVVDFRTGLVKYAGLEQAEPDNPSKLYKQADMMQLATHVLEHICIPRDRQNAHATGITMLDVRGKYPNAMGDDLRAGEEAAAMIGQTRVLDHWKTLSPIQQRITQELYRGSVVLEHPESNNCPTFERDEALVEVLVRLQQITHTSLTTAKAILAHIKSDLDEASQDTLEDFFSASLAKKGGQDSSTQP
eukprot:scpid72283/ scgid32927/ 